MEKTVFIFVRHAESKKNIRDITGGYGAELTDEGKRQAVALGLALLDVIKNEDVDIVSSNTIQTIQTAELVSDVLKKHYLVTDRLKPAGMGVIDGLTKSEVQKKYPQLAEQMVQWRNCELEAIELEIPEMEVPIDFWNRIIDYLKEINDGKNKIIVCTRSVMVLVYNLVKGNVPELGGRYKHMTIGNCDIISFSSDAEFQKIQLIEELTSDDLR